MCDIHRGFQDVDEADASSSLFQFLDAANAIESIGRYRQRMLDLQPVAEGSRVLDVGCGLGHAARDLSPHVGASGAVVGVDASEALITEAIRRTRQASVSPTFQVGDARRLDFATDAFDLCRVERVLMYLDRPDTAVDEMLRVLRPGGHVALFEFDYDCIVVDAPDQEVTRLLMRRVADSIPSPWIGRRLPRLLRDRGVQDLTVESHIVATPMPMFRRVVDGTLDEAVARGELDAGVVRSWWDDLDRLDDDGRFFSGFIGFVITGRAAANLESTSVPTAVE